MAVFYNQATLSYHNTTTNSNIVTGEILEPLTVSKTSIPETYRSGDLITYTVTIVNSGSVAVTGLTLTDDLGEYQFNTGTLVPLDYVEDSVRYFSNGVLQPAPVVTAGPPLTISGISVPAGDNAVILYQATVNEFAPLGADGTILNTVTVNGTTATAITASDTITANQEALLTISKSVAPTIITDNGELTYTFTIQNIGGTALTTVDDTVITDLFNPLLNLSEVTFNGTIWTSPDQYTYNDVTGLFMTTAGQVTVPAATYTQDPVTGAYSITPGTSVLKITGTVASQVNA